MIQLSSSEFEWTLGVVDGQGGLACYDSWGSQESDTTEQLNWTEVTVSYSFCSSYSNWVSLLFFSFLFLLPALSGEDRAQDCVYSNYCFSWFNISVWFSSSDKKRGVNKKKNTQSTMVFTGCGQEHEIQWNRFPHRGSFLRFQFCIIQKWHKSCRKHCLTEFVVNVFRRNC